MYFNIIVKDNFVTRNVFYYTQTVLFSINITDVKLVNLIIHELKWSVETNYNNENNYTLYYTGCQKKGIEIKALMSYILKAAEKNSLLFECMGWNSMQPICVCFMPLKI